MDLDLCHLLLLPAGAAPLGELEQAPAPRDAPDFFAVEIEFRSAGGRALEVGGVRVDVTCQVLDDLVWLADCRYQLADALAEDAPARKRAIEDALHDQLLLQAGASTGIEVRYTVVMVDACPEPEAFVADHATALARLVRTLPKQPGALQVEEILRARASYSHSDLTIVDWVGGLIITDQGGHQYDIELLKIGNYQLLRSRSPAHDRDGGRAAAGAAAGVREDGAVAAVHRRVVLGARVLADRAGAVPERLAGRGQRQAREPGRDRRHCAREPGVLVAAGARHGAAGRLGAAAGGLLRAVHPEQRLTLRTSRTLTTAIR
jgi:hypothetical protein